MASTKRYGVVAGVVLVVLLVGFLVLQHLLDADTYRGRIEAALSDSLGRKVTLGHLDFSLFSGSLVASSPSIADDPGFSQQPFLEAKEVQIGVETGAFLFHHQIHITSFTIDEPKITLIRASNGTWNYSSIGAEGKRKTSSDTDTLLPNLKVGKIDIKDGAITLGRQGVQNATHTYTHVNVGVQNFSFDQAFPFTVSGELPAGGTLQIQGNAGPVNPKDASLTPLTAQIDLKGTDLVAAGLVDAGQGVAGVTDVHAKIVSNGQSAQADGTVHVEKLKLAQNGVPSSQPVDLQFSVNQNLQALSGTIQSATVKIGQATMTVGGTYQTSNNVTQLQLKVDGQSMPINNLEAFLPSMGVQLPSGSRLQGGTLSTTLNVTGPSTAPSLSGPVRVLNTQLAGFDLGQKLASIQALTGAKTGSTTVIQVLSTNLQHGPQGTRTDNLSVVVSGLGSASGSGAISTGGVLNYSLLVKLSTNGVGGLATQAMSLLPGEFGSALGQTTKNGIPVNITGTTSNPVFTPNMSRLIGGSVKNQNSNPIGNVLSGLFHR